MDDQYRKTSERMYSSAFLLHNNRQFFNACYLAGYVIECYQKLVIQILGSDPRMIHNLEDLKAHYKQLKNTSKARQYLKQGIILDIEQKCPTVFLMWHPTHRYDESHEWNEQNSIQFQEEIKRINHVIARMKTNGLIN